MAFDIESAAALLAHTLVLHARCRAQPAPCCRWSRSPAVTAKLRVLRGLGCEPIAPDTEAEALSSRIGKILTDRPDLCKELETKFPDLAFSPLLKTLGQRLAEHMPDGRSDDAPPLRTISEAVSRMVKEISDLLHPHTRTSEKQFADFIAVALLFHPSLAASTALAFDEALPFPWTGFAEREAVCASRKLRHVESPDGNAADIEAVGLALSGGGIRSATLSLGILQSLADLKLTRYVDYLSTVSGGGYIGSWLHAWLSNEKEPSHVAEALSPQSTPDPESIAAHPIKWLRQYSSYLAPRRGLLSPDTWTIFTVWVRNWLLNICVILLALAGALMVPRAMRIVFDAAHSGRRWWVGVLPLIFAVLVILLNLRSFKVRGVRTRGLGLDQIYIHLLVALPVLLSAMSISARLSERAAHGVSLVANIWIAAWFFVLLCAISFLGGYYDPSRWRAGIASFVPGVIVFNALSAAAGFGLLLVVEALSSEYWWSQLIWGTAGIVAVYSLVIILHLGLFGRALRDDRREWWSRVGAVQTIWLLVWVAIAGTSFYGPWACSYLFGLRGAWGKLIPSLLGSGWIGTTLAGVLKGRGEKTGPVSTDPTSDLIARIAPPVFVAGLLLLVSMLVHMLTLELIGLGFPGIERMYANHNDYLSWWGSGEAWLFAAVCLLAAFLLATRIDVNEFSMHNFYENRLVRCYLGASHCNRAPNRFTGFDPDDDFRLAKLHPFADPQRPYPGPFAVINATLNLVSGEELAWQERKAESFTFTPLYSGFAASPTEERAGKLPKRRHVAFYAYRPTADYAFPGGGIRLGRATAISGAALSPNWGYHTSPAIAFLLTVFNVRLGWWIGNPRHRRTWRRSGPLQGLGYLLTELAGAANNKSAYVYLSDGGHFENLGLYELVRRRCRYIIACDGGEDSGFAFEDLGNAIRKCRADFGVEIQIDVSAIRPAADTSGARPMSAAHCAVGCIRYPADADEPEGTNGTLIYIKASLTGNEPADVLEYAAHHFEFPHQPTSDQFFDESQFESYRKLGHHIGTTVFQAAVERRSNGSAHPDDRDAVQPPLDAGFFSELRRRWLASSPKTGVSFSRHAEVLVKLMERMRNDQELLFFERQISPEWDRLMQGVSDPLPPPDFGLPPTTGERRAGFIFCNSILQLMEDVYLDLNLEEEFEHPDNAGWMNLFDHWAWSAMFRVTWMISASCYGSRFRTFCESRLKLDPESIGRLQIIKADWDDERLNYRERELLAQADFDWSRHQVHLLEILVTRPDQHETVMVRLTVGFAVTTSHSRLAYVRVQEHLRCMGLARRFINAMLDAGLAGRQPDWHSLPENYAEPVREENKERIARLLASGTRRKPRG